MMSLLTVGKMLSPEGRRNGVPDLFRYPGAEAHPPVLRWQTRSQPWAGSSGVRENRLSPSGVMGSTSEPHLLVDNSGQVVDVPASLEGKAQPVGL